MKFWEIVDSKYFVNLDNITFISWDGKGENDRNEFTIGFTSGESQSFTTDSTQEEFAKDMKQLTGKTEKEEVEIASSEELSKPEPAWRTILEE